MNSDAPTNSGEGLIACLDAHYAHHMTFVACVLLRDWSDAEPLDEVTLAVAGAAEYRSGEFYRRELPALLGVLNSNSISNLIMPPRTVVIDGYVWLDNGRPGLGAHLHGALQGRCDVIGVAKTEFRAAPAVEVLRGGSRKPLFVSAEGVNPIDAAARIRRMHGDHRLPSILKRVDRLCRDATGSKESIDDQPQGKGPRRP